MSTRIDENGVKTKKLWLKHGSSDLFAIDLNFQGLALKKPGTKMKLNLNYRGWNAKTKALDGDSILENLEVFFVKIWTKIEIVLNCDGRRVDFLKT